MSGPPDKEHTAPPDVLAAAIEPTYSRDEHDPDHRSSQPQRGDETSEGDLGEKYNDTDADADDGSRGKAEEADEVTGPAAAALTTTKSYATDTSAATGALAPPEPQEKPWYKKMNPLRWGGIPPIPEERVVSREAKASFLSKLTFNWMTLLMTVSSQCLFKLQR